MLVNLGVSIPRAWTVLAINITFLESLNPSSCLAFQDSEPKKPDESRMIDSFAHTDIHGYVSASSPQKTFLGMSHNNSFPALTVFG